jgi:hypothetical protein
VDQQASRDGVAHTEAVGQKDLHRAFLQVELDRVESVHLTHLRPLGRSGSGRTRGDGGEQKEENARGERGEEGREDFRLEHRWVA